MVVAAEGLKPCTPFPMFAHLTSKLRTLCAWVINKPPFRLIDVLACNTVPVTCECCVRCLSARAGVSVSVTVFAFTVFMIRLAL